MARSRRRAISDIVAVVMLIIIAIAAAVLIYGWMSGLIGGVHGTGSGLYTKIEIVGANITTTTSGTYYVYATVENLGKTQAVIKYMAVENATSSSVICQSTTIYTGPTSATTTATPMSPDSIETLWFQCSTSSTPTAGNPVTIVVLTPDGVTATYQTTWP